ncbi:MAG: hypothetical protein A2007_03805 [Verrucomicrobia bacterium GWC2_42_7]|nr:MAG: hypothetical protein A2007_03805 [Verrucomicrobia bacterium GWC2_42_7]
MLRRKVLFPENGLRENEFYEKDMRKNSFSEKGFGKNAFGGPKAFFPKRTISPFLLKSSRRFQSNDIRN